MEGSRALGLSPSLKLASGAFVAFWCLLAAFPIFWIAVMSVKLPIDAFSANPLHVIFGASTMASGKGLSVIDIAGRSRRALRFRPICLPKASELRPAVHSDRLRRVRLDSGRVAAGIGVRRRIFHFLPPVLGAVNNLLGPIGRPIIGVTGEHYVAVWIENQFTRNFMNSLIVTTGVVVVSLTVGTLAGYGLARSGSVIAFWILVAALIFRALPHSVLVAGYLPVFVNSAEILRPILGEAAPTLYGQPLAVIAVLVSINQPFTIWMLRSFFQNIPADLDEAARVDGCTHFQAFRWVIMPVMWPGVITTGLFSFLLAYNDFLVTSLLLDAQNQTMVPAIVSYFNMETTTTDQVEAVAAAVSITAPLLLLVMVFQRQIVSGLTAGAVKG